MFKRVFINTGTQIVGKGITASITLLITLIIGRTLGPSGFGDFTKIFVFVGYFYTLADFGLNTIYIKIAEENEVIHLRPLLGLRLIIGVSLALVSTAIAFMLPYDPYLSTGFSPLVKTGIAIASVTIATQALFTTANAFFQKILRYDLSALSAVSGYLLILALAAIVSLTSKSILGYTTAYVIGGLTLVAVAYLIIARRTKVFFTPAFSKEKFVSFLKPAWPIGIALLFNLIYFRIDVFILSNFRTSLEVGLYGLSYQFFEAALAVPIFFSNATYPMLVKLYQENRDKFKKQVKNWVVVLLGISSLLSISMFVIAFFIPILFGESFRGSTPSLQILSLGFPFFFVSALLWHLLIIYDKQKYLTAIYAAGAAFNIIANIIFIPKNGYIAASIITVVSEALIAALLIAALRFRNFKI